MARLELDKSQALTLSKFHAHQLVYRASLATTGLAKQLVPVKSGQTRASLGFSIREVRVYRVVGRVGSNKRKAHWLHEGTRAHVIRPKRKKALKFVSGGETFIRAVVRHPGIGSTPFLTTAMRLVCVPLGFRVERNLPARLQPTDDTLAP